MFNKEKKMAEPKVSERNSLAKNTKVIGDITADGDFRIDGTLEGTLKVKGKVIIGNSGYIKGSITCNEADIEGKFSGELQVANLLTLKSSAIISGNVVTEKLSVTPGASFDAVCSMKGTVKELTINGQKKQIKETAS